MPPKKRGRPARAVGPARPTSPTFQPVFSKPKMVSRPKPAPPSDNEVKSEPSFFEMLPPAIFGGIAPPPALAGPSSKAAVMSFASEEDTDITFLCGPISGPESEDGDGGLEAFSGDPSITPAPPSTHDPVPMSVDIRAPSPSPDADDELDESEPSMDQLVERGKVLRANMVNMVEELDSWISLVQHYHKSKKSSTK